MGTNAQFPVVYHATYGYHETEVLIDACLANPVLAPLVDIANYRKLEQIPRHHPELVTVVRKLIEDKTPKRGDFDIIMIDSPMYRIESYEGNESVICTTDLRLNAGEFTEVAKHPYRLNFNGFNPKLCFVETIYTLDTGSAVRLWVNVLPTEHLPLLKNYEPGERLQLVDQLVLYHDLGAIQRFGAEPVVFLQDAPGDLQVSINIGECLFIRRMLPGSGYYIYVPE